MFFFGALFTGVCGPGDLDLFPLWTVFENKLKEKIIQFE